MYSYFVIVLIIKLNVNIGDSSNEHWHLVWNGHEKRLSYGHHFLSGWMLVDWVSKYWLAARLSVEKANLEPLSHLVATSGLYRWLRLERPVAPICAELASCLPLSANGPHNPLDGFRRRFVSASFSIVWPDLVQQVCVMCDRGFLKWSCECLCLIQKIYQRIEPSGYWIENPLLWNTTSLRLLSVRLVLCALPVSFMHNDRVTRGFARGKWSAMEILLYALAPISNCTRCIYNRSCNGRLKTMNGCGGWL